MSAGLGESAAARAGGGAGAWLRPLEFDSRCLGLECAALELEPRALAAGPGEAGGLMARALAETPPAGRGRLTVAKTPAGEGWARAAELAGGRVIDRELVFRRPGAGPGPLPAGVGRHRRWPARDFLALAEELEHSRLLRDPRVPPTAARELWRRSVANHCQGRAAELLVAMAGGRPAGLVVVNRPAPGHSELFLVGVLAAHRRQGVGGRLMAAAAAARGPAETVSVEALAANRPAARLYRSAGFSPAAERLVVHFWQEGEGTAPC